MTDALSRRRAFPDDARIDRWTAPDGWPLRVFDREVPGSRGSILWLGGRGDIIEKYLECLAAWHDAGWHTTSFDWRGQGGSGRVLSDATTGHIDDFATWIADLAAFWRDWTARTPAPHIIMGHSMGGHLVLRALIERAVAPHAAVLVAPMLGFGGAIPAWLAGPVARLLGRIVPQKRAWKDNERPAPPTASRQAFLTHDPERYSDEMWWKDRDTSLALGPPSWGWMAAAARSYRVIDARGAVEGVNLPVLVIATEGDQLVSPAAIRRAAARLPHGDLLMFGTDVAHEVLRERDAIRDQAMARIAGFLEAKVLAR